MMKGGRGLRGVPDLADGGPALAPRSRRDIGNTSRQGNLFQTGSSLSDGVRTYALLETLSAMVRRRRLTDGEPGDRLMNTRYSCVCRSPRVDDMMRPARLGLWGLRLGTADDEKNFNRDYMHAIE